MSLLQKIQDLEDVLKKEQLTVDDLVAAISSEIACNSYLVSAEGKILSYSLAGSNSDKNADLALKLEFKQRVGFVFQTVANLPLEANFLENDNSFAPNTHMAIVPIHHLTSTAGHLLLTKKAQQFSEEELILAEASSLIAGIYLYEKANENNSDSQHNNIEMVLESLSFSEIKAIHSVFTELNGLEGFLVASKIADRIGISRSVIVNAMRKLESAGIVNSRSLGIKGTYIKIKNSSFLEALKLKVR
ncbi:MAG TPA: GTP-sensing pleiotropic transcriptional regulator CodY [Firmicutes bacterium]|jgi:transcriptional pleiotropic repressor|nr:GTP-sensing pleiotropic transcriptional regulator CodY [Bacillota bacterium]